MNEAVLNIVMLILSIGLIIFVARKKKLSYKNDIGLIFPNWKNLIFWITAFVILIALEEFIYEQFIDTITVPWKEKYSTSQMILRGIGIVLLAPITEELIFRGLLFWRIKNTKLKTVGAIIIPAILFSAIHIQYSELLTLGIILIDGIFYGLARHYSKSVILAIILHSLSNLGAVLERVL
jgi:membrane protease YdiL (CAAX protease family)